MSPSSLQERVKRIKLRLYKTWCGNEVLLLSQREGEESERFRLAPFTMHGGVAFCFVGEDDVVFTVGYDLDNQAMRRRLWHENDAV